MAAENILGLLFVTSSSRGRSVFRYPPDPLSPHTRLSQPIYSSATITAKETTITPTREKLFPTNFALADDRKSSNASWKGSSKNAYMRAWSHGGKAATDDSDFQANKNDEIEEDSDESSVSSDDDPEQIREMPQRQAGKRGSDGEVKVNGVNGKNHLDGTTSTATTATATMATERGDVSRRGSMVDEVIANAKPGKTSNGNDKFVEDQYTSALDYSLDFLGDMLTPPRSACNRKFEICVNELCFVGHPVTHGPDGRWAFPEEEEDEGVRSTARGRRRVRDDRQDKLSTLVEGKEGTSPDTDGGNFGTGSGHGSGSGSEEKDGPPHLNMFHLVIIIDKPDPKKNATEHEGTTAMSFVDEVYREIAFKWTAAAFALQVKDNFIARQAWEIAKFREKCREEGISILECSRRLYDMNLLDRSLNHLFSAIHDLQTKPANPLYTHLPTTITINLVDVPVSMVLSPPSGETDEAWAHWGEMDEVSSDGSDDESDTAWDAPKSVDLRVEAWQTLLLVEEDAAEKAQEISRALVGLGVSDGGLDDSEEPSPMVASSRRGSKEAGTATEDEGLLMKALIEACDVTKKLVDIAHILRYDLDGIVIPLARELVQNKKAILIDVINTRLRTMVMPTTIAEHTASLHEYSGRFTRMFPSLPPFPVLISMISASPVQFRELLPPEAPSNISIRQTYMDALVWLLKQDLVVQVHTRARVFARPAIKEVAWRKLWHRRRERWLRRRRSSIPQIQTGSEGEDLVTPRASDAQPDPLQSSEVQEGLVPAPKMDSSFLDYDPDIEMDSDLNEDDDQVTEKHDMGFSMDEVEPKDVPKFEGSFIFRPARAQKDEARWLRAIRETAEDVWASKFDLCVQYFDGIATFEEISYRTGMQRRELEKILQLFPEDVITFVHP